MLRIILFSGLMILSATSFCQENNDLNADIPFAVIENVPVYPGCENNKSNQELKDCMSTSISELINKKYNLKVANNLGLEGRQRIWVQFKIDKQGDVVDINIRAPHEALEKETLRVMKLLPQMKPGKQKGEAVGVLYSLPIIFDIVAPAETKREKKERLKAERKN